MQHIMRQSTLCQPPFLRKHNSFYKAYEKAAAAPHGVNDTVETQLKKMTIHTETWHTHARTYQKSSTHLYFHRSLCCCQDIHTLWQSLLKKRCRSCSGLEYQESRLSSRLASFCSGLGLFCSPCGWRRLKAV